MSSKFCTVEQVRAQLRTETGYTGDDSLIESSIIAATAMIRQFTRRDWTASEFTDYFDTADIDAAIRRGRGVYTVSLREKPVNVTDMLYPKLRYSASGKWNDTADIDLAYYTVDVRKNQIIMYPGVMESRARSLRCVYTAGYPVDVTDTELLLVPQNLKQACIAQACYMVRRELNATAGTSRDGEGNRNRGYWVTQTGFVREALALIRTDVRLFVGGGT